MEEQFETRKLIEPDELRRLLSRNDAASAFRLTLHLGAFIWLIAAIIQHADQPGLAFLLSLVLAWVWAGLFAPFHECTHQSAFLSPLGNKLGVWLTGVPFLMAPSVYRTFHFEHHRHTQDLEKDPELANDPRYAAWPLGWPNWLTAATGIGLIQLKLSPLFGFCFKAESEWEQFARWAPKIPDRIAVVRECMLLLMLWALFIVAAIVWIPGGGWLLFAAWFAHVFQGLWIMAEHTGLPHEGTILARTRSVTSNAFVRFWLWNMNYHAEHHAWPGMPWHQLPAAHQQIQSQLDSFVPGYVALHRNVINGINTPSCDPQ